MPGLDDATTLFFLVSGMHELTSTASSIRGALRNLASTSFRTSLVMSLTKSRSALYWPGWMLDAAVLCRRPES